MLPQLHTTGVRLDVLGMVAHLLAALPSRPKHTVPIMPAKDTSILSRSCPGQKRRHSHDQVGIGSSQLKGFN